ncbi:PLP-dependent aminotransferase family protein [Streptomyces sp. A7024]|uniref:PLP-dependent aminotransferase family protein n=1 Tax=Streptomyces coryli TaxID=1128680 RepID=A0A6G4TZH1_9ACTN|nr:PLP-dependent aminotransferase family protein [Streptomyces coryli]
MNVSDSTPPAPLAERFSRIDGSALREILALTARPGVISFAGGLPAPELFDAGALQESFAAALGRPHQSLQYSTTDGDPDLREAIAARYAARGFRVDAGELLVTSGSQQALSLAATALLDEGDVALVEDPGYLAALQCFTFAGARTVPVATDDDGILPDALEETVRRERPKLLYLVPNFQNPTGRTLPADRRRAIAALAARYGFWIVEDDPYGELRYDGTPLPPVAAEPAAADRTILLGSLSKIMAPGLRLGWLHAPEAALSACATAKQSADLHTSTVAQAAAAAYLTRYDLDAHVAKMRGVYAERRDAMLAGLPAALPVGSTWNRPDGGMFIWARLPEDRDATTLLRRAVDQDVAFVPGAPFYAGEPDRATLRLSFTSYPPAEIDEGLARLAKAASA